MKEMYEPMNPPDELFLTDLEGLLGPDAEVPDGLVRRLKESTFKSAATETRVSKPQAIMIACLVFLIAAKASVAPFSIILAILGASLAGLYAALVGRVVDREMSDT